MTTPAAADIPATPLDKIPLLLIPAVMLVSLPFIGSFPSWVTLTVAGLAMGMMIFVMASGLSLIFGLMDVLNFAHGAFITVVLNFLIIAFILFQLVKISNRMKKAEPPAPPPAASTTDVLLAEIRDARLSLASMTRHGDQRVSVWANIASHAAT